MLRRWKSCRVFAFGQASFICFTGETTSETSYYTILASGRHIARARTIDLINLPVMKSNRHQKLGVIVNLNRGSKSIHTQLNSTYLHTSSINASAHEYVNAYERRKAWSMATICQQSVIRNIHRPI